MKKAFLIAALALAAGCVSETKYGEFEPKGVLSPSDAAAYDDYGPAMAHNDKYAMAYEWQRQNPQVVKAATTPTMLAGWVAYPEAADRLLSRIGTAYDGDPLALTQIAAVTEYVMCPKYPKAAERRLWVSALKRARAKSDDGYVKTFCDQQLRICE